MAGLTAAYLLHRRHRVTLFEKSSRVGGNAYTHVTPDGEAPDIGVAAFGKAGYKNFYNLLSELNVETELCHDSYMSFHNLDTKEGLYLTLSFEKVRAQGFSLLQPSNLWNLFRVFVGLQVANRMLESKDLEHMTLEQCLKEVPQMTGDSRIVFLSALCLLSSMDAPELLASPALFFFGKLQTHHDVISPKAIYSVRCAKHGTRAYVNALAAPYRKSIVFNARIRKVIRSGKKVSLVMRDGTKKTFDKVVFACNPDQALGLIASPTRDENRLLGAWRYKDGRVVVHRDHSHFPARDLIEAYTFLYTERRGKFRTSVNGALWREPHVADDCEYISSQHPNFSIRKELVDLETTLRTPVFDFASCATIGRLPALNNVNNSYFCGSYFGYGLHEDAVTSAMAAAKFFR